MVWRSESLTLPTVYHPFASWATGSPWSSKTPTTTEGCSTSGQTTDTAMSSQPASTRHRAGASSAEIFIVRDVA